MKQLKQGKIEPAPPRKERMVYILTLYVIIHIIKFT